MSEPRARPHDFTLIVLPESFGSSVAVSVDFLDAARTLAPHHGVPAPRWRLRSLDGGTVRFSSGLSLETTRLNVRSAGEGAIWIVPGLSLTTERAVREGLQHPAVRRLSALLARHVRRGGRVAATCSAVFLLAAEGLLSGRRVTTTWWLAPLMRQLAPDCVVDADRMVCADGPIITAGAAMAQTDLMLHLLRAQCGAPLAQALSRFMLVDAREAQARYVVPEVLAGGDALTARIVDLVERALPAPMSVADLADALCVSERTLARHVQRVTGRSTLALIQAVRVRRARALLEQSRMPVEAVAAAVGYADATALRRLMKRAAGGSPRQFRPAVHRGV